MTQPPDDRGALNGCILVVDDDHIIQLVIQKILQQAGYGADSAVNGKEAISALESRHYDLVLMDCNMPIMDGFATTRFIRNDTSGRFNPGIPIVALSGSASKTDQLQCLDAGMNTHVSKPVDPNKLIAAIEQCLGLDAAEKPASEQSDRQGKPIWNDGFLDTIIARFLAEVPQVIAGIQQAVKQGNLVELQNISHKLRGATDILEASSLSTLSKALENAGKAGDLTLAGRLAQNLIEELHKLTAALKE